VKVEVTNNLHYGFGTEKLLNFEFLLVIWAGFLGKIELLVWLIEF
jgi:hypothetical protein